MSAKETRTQQTNHLVQKKRKRKEKRTKVRVLLLCITVITVTEFGGPLP